MRETLIDIESKIEEFLRKGHTKKKIRQELKDSCEEGKLEFYLNNLSYPKDRKKYQYLNLSLAIMLGFITIKKLFFALSFGTFNLTMLLALVVPTVNLFILREIMKFHRIGYQFLSVLAPLSLLHWENRVMPELFLFPLMTVLSIFLYFNLFPRSERIIQ